jgi:hypothetical protein
METAIGPWRFPILTFALVGLRLVVANHPYQHVAGILPFMRLILEQFTAQSGGTQEFDALMKRLKPVQTGRRFSRDEMNDQ